MDRDSTVDVSLTLREVVALQFLTVFGENQDPEAIASIGGKMEPALERFRVAMGTKRFAAYVKNSSRHLQAQDAVSDDAGLV